MTDTARILWKAIGYSLLFGVILIPALLLDGFVALRLYQWFVEPTFASAPHIHLAEALGLTLLVGFFSRQFIRNPEAQTFQQKLEPVIFMYLAPFVTLGIGYIVHLFV